MTLDAADLVGLIGSTLFVGAFAYANASPAMNKLVFNVLNLIGAVLLLISLSVHFNLASMALEVAWAAIAAAGLIGALLGRRTGS